MTRRFRICPICNSVLNVRENKLYCIRCDETFEYDSKYKVWRNPHIMDVAYTDPVSSVLSNLFPHKFTLNTIYGKKTFNSVEAFLLTICWPGTAIGIYDELASLSGIDASRAKNVLPDWKEKQEIMWNGRFIKRDSAEYKELLKLVFDSLFEQSHLFRLGLLKSESKVFMNVSGERDPRKTLITSNEFISLLERERNRIKV